MSLTCSGAKFREIGIEIDKKKRNILYILFIYIYFFLMVFINISIFTPFLIMTLESEE